MSFDEILKHYKTKTCILSVEKLDDNHYGNIKVVAGNQAHYDDILHITGHPFVPGCPYEMCFPKNLNFEDFCYRCAIGGEPMHSYVSLYQMGLWLNMFMIPLISDEENTGYCIYSYDVTPQANTEKMSDVSADAASSVLETCIKLHGASDFKKAINEVIADIRDVCSADECCILYLDEDTRKCTCLAESRKEDAPYSIDDFLNDEFYYIAKKWEYTLQGSTCIIIKDEHDREEIRNRDPELYAGMEAGEIESLVLFPLKQGEMVFGYIWALNFDTENVVKIKETLELTTFFVASEIANNFLMERLRTMSSIDMLTGIMNRNIMNNRVDRVIAGKDVLETPYAIIFTDLNGLKRLNDTEGHQTGDEALKEAAHILSDVFYDGEVYRVGGDEFMVIACNMDPDTVNNRVKDLVDKANKSESVRFAVGVSLSEDEPDILKAMRVADKRMYDDKKRYYEEHPDRIYR
ncbi:MAG: GGDEF domain-containing protein [Clostridiales bacterium]|nr:GGDEF domain-containing protein [Clostridiales bacterium]